MSAFDRHGPLVTRLCAQQRQPKIGQPITCPVQPSRGGKSWRNLAAKGKAFVEPSGQFTQQRFGFIE